MRSEVADARRALILAGAVPVAVTTGIACSFAWSNLLFFLGGCVAIALMNLSQRYVTEHAEACPSAKENPVLASRSYLTFLAKRARLNERAVLFVVWGLWAPIACGFAFLVVSAVVDIPDMLLEGAYPG